jgi:hypothetical protein
MAENLDFILMQKAMFDAFASTHRRSFETVDRRADDQARTTEEPRAAQGSPPLHN